MTCTARQNQYKNLMKIESQIKIITSVGSTVLPVECRTILMDLLEQCVSFKMNFEKCHLYIEPFQN